MVRKIGLLAGIAGMLFAIPASAKVFVGTGLYSRGGPTLREDAREASLILLGTLANPRLAPGSKPGDENAPSNGTTDFHILGVLRSDPALKDRKVLELPVYVPVVAPKNPPRFLILCDVVKGKIEPFRAVKVESQAAVDYFKGVMALNDKDHPKALEFFFRYLDHPDEQISQDAFWEFDKADHQTMRAVAKRLSGDKLAAWLKDPKTPRDHLSLYAMLLGYGGHEKHVDLFSGLLKHPDKLIGLEEVLVGYIHLKPKEGWQVTRRLLSDPTCEFCVRYGALTALRFFWEEQIRLKEKPGLVAKKDLLEGLNLALAHADMADFAIEDLRKWQRWESTEKVLALHDKKTHEVATIKRAILRFAL